MELSSIVRFPIKSCRGISVPRARVVRGGIENDRRWMIVDADGRFVTQREEHRLALVDVAIDAGVLAHAGRGEEWPSRPRTVADRAREPLIDGDDAMRISADGHGELALPLGIGEGPRAKVVVWSSEVLAIEHEEGSAWFAAFLGRDVRLVYMPDDALRQVNPARSKAGDVVSFADGYPLLLASESSLDDLGDRIEANGGTRVPMTRFRPNVVVRGAPAWDEDTWRTLSLGGIAFRVPKPCDRCVMTTIDPATAQTGKEPLRTLASFRRWALEPGGSVGVWFGVNLIPDDEGEIAVGDAITIDMRG